MSNSIITLSTLSALAYLASSAAAVPFSANFETDQSAQFTITTSSSDANSNFVYDSSTHVQEGGDPLVIGPAPGSATTKVLRLNANISDNAVVDSVVAYPTVTGLGAGWSMTYNVWNNYNGPAQGGSGSTEMHLFGATSDTTIAPTAATSPSIAGDGFYFTMAGEGGASADYRFYSGTGTITANNPGVSWLGGAPGTNLNNLDTAWLDFYTTPTFESVGAPGKQWISVRLTVNGTNAIIAIKRPADANFVDVGNATVPATATKPFVGYSDINTGFSSTPAQVASQFVLIDNLLIDNLASGVHDWSVY